jgi:ORF6N domain
MATKKTAATAAPVADIARAILVLHRQRVILDSDLAALYGVTTKRLNEQVKRNAARFPEDFMFRLSTQETEALNRSHFATGSQKHRDPRFPPFAFTEHGAILSTLRELMHAPAPKRRAIGFTPI